jgi:hypothetical protein
LSGGAVAESTVSRTPNLGREAGRTAEKPAQSIMKSSFCERVIFAMRQPSEAIISAMDSHYDLRDNAVSRPRTPSHKNHFAR